MNIINRADVGVKEDLNRRNKNARKKNKAGKETEAEEEISRTQKGTNKRKLKKGEPDKLVRKNKIGNEQLRKKDKRVKKWKTTRNGKGKLKGVRSQNEEEDAVEKQKKPKGLARKRNKSDQKNRKRIKGNQNQRKEKLTKKNYKKEDNIGRNKKNDEPAGELMNAKRKGGGKPDKKKCSPKMKKCVKAGGTCKKWGKCKTQVIPGKCGKSKTCECCLKKSGEYERGSVLQCMTQYELIVSTISGLVSVMVSCQLKMYIAGLSFQS